MPRPNKAQPTCYVLEMRGRLWQKASLTNTAFLFHKAIRLQ